MNFVNIENIEIFENLRRNDANMTMETADRKYSAAEIYADVKGKLTSGKFLQGGKLRAERLRHTYNCSASTVREVFLKLACEGHLEAIEQRGFRVPMGTSESRTDLIRMRVLLEKEGLKLSLENGGLDWEAELAASYHKLAHIENVIQQSGKIVSNMLFWNEAEYAFHKALISACDSKLLAGNPLQYLQSLPATVDQR